MNSPPLSAWNGEITSYSGTEGKKDKNEKINRHKDIQTLGRKDVEKIGTLRQTDRNLFLLCISSIPTNWFPRAPCWETTINNSITNQRQRDIDK